MRTCGLRKHAAEGSSVTSVLIALRVATPRDVNVNHGIHLFIVMIVHHMVSVNYCTVAVHAQQDAVHVLYKQKQEQVSQPWTVWTSDMLPLLICRKDEAEETAAESEAEEAPAVDPLEELTAAIKDSDTDTAVRLIRLILYLQHGTMDFRECLSVCHMHVFNYRLYSLF